MVLKRWIAGGFFFVNELRFRVKLTASASPHCIPRFMSTAKTRKEIFSWPATASTSRTARVRRFSGALRMSSWFSRTRRIPLKGRRFSLAGSPTHRPYHCRAVAPPRDGRTHDSQMFDFTGNDLQLNRQSRQESRNSATARSPRSGGRWWSYMVLFYCFDRRVLRKRGFTDVLILN